MNSSEFRRFTSLGGSEFGRFILYSSYSYKDIGCSRWLEGRVVTAIKIWEAVDSWKVYTVVRDGWKVQ